MFKREILKAISSLDALSPFHEFSIVNPTSDISHFIDENNNEFNEYGWNLSKGSYKHKWVREECKNVLFIRKI